MTALPTGVVTFVFSDIEGSTRHWETDAEGMRRSLAAHDDVTRSLVDEAGGVVFKHTGDGFAAAFSSARSALDAAATIAEALASHDWAGPVLQARLGVHTGESEPRDDDYFGPTVTKAARVMEAANGRQITVSAATHALVGEACPAGTTFIDAGLHRLKDLGEPTQLFRLVGVGASDDRALRTLDASPNNLPVQLSSFVGREEEIAQVSALLEQFRLVTLTGIGGVGKTRLSLQVAAENLHSFDDGAWFVELASLTESGLLADSVCEALGAPADNLRPAMERLLGHLAGKGLLLVIDNCEHLIDEVAKLTDHLLRSLPELRILATSREGLAVTGEALWRVPSLTLDDAGTAMALFEERAALVRPDFTITDENRDVVEQLCRRLDGIPLAIELATARLKMLTVEQIAEHLGDRFRLLTGGSRTAVERQRTLLAMMDWSYDLLTSYEQALIRRLAVFYDGFSLEAVEQVCSGEELPVFEVLDLLGRLVEASMVSFEEADPPRYRLLETVRQYSLEKLVAAGEADEARLRHASFFAEVAEQMADLLEAGRAEGSEIGVAELGNFRAAMTWAYESGQGELGLRTAVAVRPDLWNRVMNREALRWLVDGLELVTDDDLPMIPRALAYAYTEAFNVGNDEVADWIEPRLERVLAAAEDPLVRADLSNSLATGFIYSDAARTKGLYQEAMAEYRSVGSDRWVAPLTNLMISSALVTGLPLPSNFLDLVAESEAQGLAQSSHPLALRAGEAFVGGDYERAIRLAVEGEMNDEWERGVVASIVAASHRALGNLDAAARAIAEADAIMGATFDTATAWTAGFVALERGDTTEARRSWARQLGEAESGRKPMVRSALALACALAASADADHAGFATLAGYALVVGRPTGARMEPANQRLYAAAESAAREALGNGEYERIHQLGAATPWEEIGVRGLLG